MKRRIGLFYQIASVLKSTGHFFISGGGANPGPQDTVPETRAPAKFCVTLWLQFVVRPNIVDLLYLVRRHVCCQHMLDLALWAEKILKLNVFLCNFKKNA